MRGTFRGWPESLQVVLGSPVKLELLCLLQRGAMVERELAERLTRPIEPHLVRAHVRTLEDRGWIVARRTRDAAPRADVQWTLSDPQADWVGLVRLIHRFAPRPGSGPPPTDRPRSTWWR